MAVTGLLLLMAACSSQPVLQPGGKTANVKQALLRQYESWQGVPYRLGGTTKRGVDCSALVQITYKELFALDLPRKTEDQSHLGSPVKTVNRQSGDLVFFKTGRTGRHVGIYLEDGRFMHASTRRGVMISNMSDNYWRRHYWKTQRLLK